MTTESGKFMASDFHNIALMDGTYSFAKDVNGKFLFNGEQVLSVKNVTETGIYAPLTQTSNFYIMVGESERTLAHSYAYIQNPEFYEPFVNFILAGWGILYTHNDNDIHPAAKWMQKVFSFLLDQWKNPPY